MKTIQQKCEEAKERNANWNTLSIEEQIADLEKRPGNSKKQLEKLKKKLETVTVESNKKKTTKKK